MFRIRIPILSAMGIAGWPDVREAFREVFVILFFSLMPLWLGFLITKLLILPDSGRNYLENFASSSDLGLISAAFLGPLLYVILKEEGSQIGGRVPGRFPNGFWFVIGIILCCVITTMIYSFTYLSGIGVQRFIINRHFVEYTSWAIFFVSIFLVFSFATIRNAIGRLGPSAYQQQVSHEEDALTEQLRRAPPDANAR